MRFKCYRPAVTLGEDKERLEYQREIRIALFWKFLFRKIVNDAFKEIMDSCTILKKMFNQSEFFS